MLNAAVRKVAVLQMNVGLGLDKSIGHYHLKGFCIRRAA